MLQVFHADVPKVDLDVTMLNVFHTHTASVLSVCCILSRDLECSMQHETDVVAVFFLAIDGWMDNNFFQHALMLQILIFDVAYMSFSMLQMLI